MAVPVLPPEQMYPAGVDGVTARFITTANGESVRVAESGDTTAPKVLLLHGWGCSVYSFRHLFAPLAARGLHAIAPDLRGHGLSAKSVNESSYTLAAMASHVTDVVNALGIENPILLGHSMGGRIAAELALREPGYSRALLLINSAGFGPMPHVTLARPFATVALARHLPVPLPSWLVRIPVSAVYGSRGRCSDRDVEEYRAPSQFPEFLIAMVHLLRNFDWSEIGEAAAERIRSRTHLIAGELDRVVTTCRSGGAARRQSGGWQIESVKGVGHVVHEESPADVLRVLDGMLHR